ncbi:hypothetical protein EMMF5_006119 [Cystobasidiomycetes sp. EMM_F5]
MSSPAILSTGPTSFDMLANLTKHSSGLVTADECLDSPIPENVTQESWFHTLPIRQAKENNDNMAKESATRQLAQKLGNLPRKDKTKGEILVEVGLGFFWDAFDQTQQSPVTNQRSLQLAEEYLSAGTGTGDRHVELNALDSMVKVWPEDAHLQAQLGHLWLDSPDMDHPLRHLLNARNCFSNASIIDAQNQHWLLMLAQIDQQLQNTSYHGPSRAHTVSTPTDYGRVVSPSRAVISVQSRPPTPVMHHVIPELSPIEEISELPSRSRPRAASVGLQTSPINSAGWSAHAAAADQSSTAKRSRSLCSSKLARRIEAAVEEVQEASRRIDPLIAQTQDRHVIFERHVESMHHGLDGRLHAVEGSMQHFDTRLLRLEAKPAGPRNLNPMNAKYSDINNAINPARPASTPATNVDLRSLDRNELLERSIMLYGVWAMEQVLAETKTQ